MTHVSAKFGSTGFHCLYSDCGTFARQSWRPVLWSVQNPNYPSQNHQVQIPNLVVAVCDRCGKFSIWKDSNLVHPELIAAPEAHADMPGEVTEDYEEARALYQQSSRSSAALLRLVIQKICIKLGQPGKNLNTDIGELVKQGLPIRIQQSLDIVRVVGNNQVHPGVLDVRDEPAIALMLFELVNLIVEDRIASPKHIEAMYAKLPETARKQIEERDAKGKPGTP